jgi:UDP-N-acetylglucosamine--N-acetylmuramyl-(pentapeptide) pyrophosphoryl-undecaprenol N-acetylglucosamine transferase
LLIAFWRAKLKEGKEDYMSTEKTIIFTGGGSGGHVLPALTLIADLRSKYQIVYIGGRSGIEKELALKNNLKYFGVYNGKLRRYLSFENLLDLFRLKLGLIQSLLIMLKYNRKNTLVFATGGFVCLPVVVAAWLTGKKVFVHEQTSRVGLANKIASYFATKVFISFESSRMYFPASKVVFSGYPLRDEIFHPEINFKNLEKFPVKMLGKPLLFITGGGNGSYLLNNAVKIEIDKLKEKYVIIHQVGKAYIEEYKKINDENYFALDFIGSEMIDVMKKAQVIISRAGAGTVSELLALKKRSIFVPLKIAQKNEQYFNAIEAKNQLGSLMIDEDEFKKLSILQVLENFEKIIPLAQNNLSVMQNSKQKLINEIEKIF